MKKDSLLDVTMGTYNGAEVCEFVGTFLLDEIIVKYDKNSIGLYDDNGLSVFKNSTWKNKKELKKTFKDFGLEIVTEYNLSIENYLDVTLNFDDGSFRPCGKPYDIIQYINKESNQPPNLIKHLPTSIEKSLSNNSSDENSIYCEDTLNKAGYIDKVVYQAKRASNQGNRNKNYQWNITWFNLSYSKSVTTRTGPSFLYLIDIHFPQKKHSFNKIFNRNNVKVS